MLHETPINSISACGSTNGTIYTLSELSDEEIVSLLERYQPDPESFTCPEDEPLPVLGEIQEAESELFTQIVAALSKTMPYGHAVLLLAIYATTVEDRVRMAVMN